MIHVQKRNKDLATQAVTLFLEELVQTFLCVHGSVEFGDHVGFLLVKLTRFDVSIHRQTSGDLHDELLIVCRRWGAHLFLSQLVASMKNQLRIGLEVEES